MRSAFIVDGLRTPIGRRGGSLKGIHAIDLLGLVIENLVSRNGIDPIDCLLYTSPSPRDGLLSRMPSSA